MYTIVTVCPHCSSSQLADGHLINKKVRCAKCKREFVCIKKIGPILWVHEAKDEIANGGFEKVVSKVLFTYGLAVPQPYQDTIISHIGITMSPGVTRDVIVHIGSARYTARLAYFKDKRGEPKLHFKWKEHDSIALAIKRMMPQAYTHFVINRSNEFLSGMSVVVMPAEQTAEFVFQVRTSDVEMLVRKNTPTTNKNNDLDSSADKPEVRDLLHELGKV